MNTPEGHRIQQNSRSIFSESVLSTPSLQAPTPHSANDVDYPRYIPVDPFRNPRSHHYVSTTIDDIPVYPTPKALHTHYSNPTEPPHGVYTPPRSPPLRPEVIGSAERGRQPSSASRPTRLFTHAHDSYQCIMHTVLRLLEGVTLSRQSLHIVAIGDIIFLRCLWRLYHASAMFISFLDFLKCTLHAFRECSRMLG
ncbi:hypothetical protein BDQ17DRAFT_508773 [Cyathus striatus]|nr:hypothetical protein BDQ17DRAFT_508773 [Cyathus striatus]